MAKTNKINNASSALTINSAYSLPTSDGSNGQVISTNGSGTLSFTSASSGSLVFLDHQTASSSSSIQFTTGISSTYTQYLLTCPSYDRTSTSSPCLLQISTDGGSSYISTNYQGTHINLVYNSTTIGNLNTTSGFMFCYPSTGNAQNSAHMWLYLPVSDYPTGNGEMNSGNTMTLSMGAYNGATITVNAFQLSVAAGTFSGEFYLYGLANS